MLTILSLGAGVQSSTLALMCMKGEITPMPDCAIFADTGCEPEGVYEYLAYLEKLLPFKVHRVMEKKGLKDNIVQSATKGARCAGAPFYTAATDGSGGVLNRKCTVEFKVNPIIRKVRQLLGLEKGQRAKKGIQVVQYIGISLDEVVRMKDSRDHYIEHQWPLIEKRMTRHDCLNWLEKNGYKIPPKSACTFCPYHNDALWRQMKMEDPKSWNEAVEIDRLIRGGVRGTKEKLYLHRSLKPLEEVDFSTDYERGQIPLFNNECEGMCGV